MEDIDSIAKKNLTRKCRRLLRVRSEGVIKAAASKKAREKALNNKNNDNAMVACWVHWLFRWRR